ncbi:MAG: hypothetical protein H8E98_00305, partial [Bacteroidetes bacterium]|nr:hypothetical protein [Bacteroidota bacterium]
MNNASGPFFSTSASFNNNTFFNNKHTLLAMYNPSDNENNGTISLIIDNKLMDVTNIEHKKIFSNYSNQPLSFGKSKHGESSYFEGCINYFMYTPKIINLTFHDLHFPDFEPPIKIYLNGKGEFNQLRLKISD